MKNGPMHFMDAEDLEPLYVPQENILEECLRREAERVAHQENLMNRVVYDSVDAAPQSSSQTAATTQKTEPIEIKEKSEVKPEMPTTSNEEEIQET